jgi:hypothetical protein
MPYLKQIFYKPVKRVKKRVVRALQLLRDKLFFERYLKNNIPVLVYQMGKVASSSVTQSLRRYYSGVVLQAHYFNPNHKDWKVRRLYRWVMAGVMPLNVISLTRDPIGRNVSAFFQNFEKHTGVPYHKANYSLEELKAIFLEKFPTRRPGQWFDRNIKENFGIDVYVNSFPKCGYATYDLKNIRLLVMRSELNDNEKVYVIRDFLNLNEFQLVNRNISAQKEYASAYEDFKRKVKLPLDYIDEICESKYFNHFYEQDLINVVRKKWSEIK